MLGNLTVEQMEARLGVEFDKTTKRRLNETYQPYANEVRGNQWHCFDIPFVFLVGEYDFAAEIHGLLSPLSAQMKDTMQMSLVG